MHLNNPHNSIHTGVEMLYHPEGLASLVAVIVAPGDVALGRYSSYDRAADVRREQVLYMAAQYYKINPCDFDNHLDLQAGPATNNLAKLNRRNLTGV
jgi:hypothetical protein